MGEFERCRKLYNKYLEIFGNDSNVWMKYAQLETKLEETERTRAIYDLAIEHESVDMPELVWRSYLDFEITQTKDYSKVRTLFEKLLKKTQHFKVWVSYAKFETQIHEIQRARDIFVRGYEYFEKDRQKNPAYDIEQHVQLLTNWLGFEQFWGSEKQRSHVSKKQPKRVKRKRILRTDDGMEAGWEEYFDYIFPDEISSKGNLKLLQRARQWKKSTEPQGT